MPPKDKAKNSRVKEDLKKMEESQDSAKFPPTGSQSTMIPSKSMDPSKITQGTSFQSTFPPKSPAPLPMNTFQWGSHATQVAPKPPSVPTNQNQEANPEPSGFKKILLEIQRSNEITAQTVKSEVTGLKTTIENSEKNVTDQIVGIKRTIEDNAKEFRNEIDRIDRKLDQTNAVTSTLIEEALKAERSCWETRWAQMETTLAEVQSNQVERIPEESHPAIVRIPEEAEEVERSRPQETV